jgi:hypothetical protein
MLHPNRLMLSNTQTAPSACRRIKATSGSATINSPTHFRSSIQSRHGPTSRNGPQRPINTMMISSGNGHWESDDHRLRSTWWWPNMLDSCRTISTPAASSSPFSKSKPTCSSVIKHSLGNQQS